MRVGVVAPRYGGPWDEQALVARRLAGALACAADVDVLVPGGTAATEELDGAVRLLRFPAGPPDRARRGAWRQVAFGPDMPEGDSPTCSCLPLQRRRQPLPPLVEEQLVLAEGGDAPELYAHLRATPYDLVVFVGLHTPAAYWGARSLPDNRKMVLVPGTPEEELIWLQLHSTTVERAERVVVFTESERLKWTERLGSDDGKVERIGLVVGVNPIARDTQPENFTSARYVIVADDWTKRPPSARLLRWAERLRENVHPNLRLRVTGPGAEVSPLGIPLTASRLDIWRWVSRAIALLDPVPQRLVGLRVVEAFLYRTPVIVHAQGGASREHAEAGGGLWFRTDDELCAMVRALLDEELARVLGEQGCSYAEAHYNDTDSFIKRVGETFLS